MRLSCPATLASQLSVVSDTAVELVLNERDEYRLHFPRDAATAERLGLQAHLLPHLRGFLSPAIPIFEARGEATRDWPHGWFGAKRLEGRPMRAETITDDNIETGNLVSQPLRPFANVVVDGRQHDVSGHVLSSSI